MVLLNTYQNNGQPPNADTTLRLAQGFALLVSLYTQSDLVDGLFMVTEGWKPFQSISTPVKFSTATVLRLMVGNLGIVSSFVLVIYAPDVVDLLLNFTAIEFVATLDGSAFEIASKGFLGRALEKKSSQIEDFKYERRVRKRSTYARLFVYFGYFCVYIGAYIVIVILQSNRHIGVHNEFYVQFDDTHVEELFGISGVYIGT